MKKLSAAAIGLLAGVAVATPAFAQGAPGMGDKESPMQKQERMKEQERKTIEQDYDKMMKRTKNQGPSQAASNDPWASVRPAATETKNDPKKR